MSSGAVNGKFPAERAQVTIARRKRGSSIFPYRNVVGSATSTSFRVGRTQRDPLWGGTAGA